MSEPALHRGGRWVASTDSWRETEPALAVLTLTTLVLTSMTTAEMVALTVAETRRLINALHHTRPDIAHLLRWSYWRRRHQALARTSHYRRRELQQLSLSS
ncbi:hypothetical protein AB0B31_25500 [Catellatospora citrea]|uniref:hypothetical protein n=1 Tax=Catellatospora citrea TaxID=53366 RepID=UPI0033E9875F